MFETLLILFLVLIIIAAVATVELKDILAAIMALSIVGGGLAVVFIFLAAPEVVSAQIIVEILTFVILVAVAHKTSKTDETKRYSIREISPATAALFFAVVFVLFALWGIKGLPFFGAPSMKVSSVYIDKIISDIGVKNIVTGILMDFRVFNTLIEVILIITLLVGVAAILRKKGKKDA